MNRLFIAAALGLGLLAAGGIAGTASAGTVGGHAMPAVAHEGAPVSPVHYYRHDDRRPHYAPTSGHSWHRYVPPRSWHPSRYDHRPYHHDWRR